LTTIHITHDLMEALEMADRVAVVQNGQVEQVAGPEEMLFYPEGEKVADFIGAPNILDCDYCRDLGQGIKEVGCGGLKLTVPHEGGTIRKVAILPRHIYVSETRPPGLRRQSSHQIVPLFPPQTPRYSRTSENSRLLKVISTRLQSWVLAIRGV
jgi:ABC-type Fe3+/spermidine/putrescine transport system ATPase subunit